jgi:hypothetical protein
LAGLAPAAVGKKERKEERMMELVPTTKMKRKLLRLEDIGGGGQEDRSIRRRVNLVGGGEDSGLTVVQHQQQQKQDFSRVASSSSAASGYGFVVLLPHGSVVKLQIDGEKADPGLSVKGFVELVRRKLSLGSSSNSKLQQTTKRQIYWGSHVTIQDLSHNLLEDGAFFPPRHCEPVRTLLLQVGPDSALLACAASFFLCNKQQHPESHPPAFQAFKLFCEDHRTAKQVSSSSEFFCVFICCCTFQVLITCKD